MAINELHPSQNNYPTPSARSGNNPASSVPRSTPVSRSAERQPLHSPGSRFSSAAVGSYGSILTSPLHGAPTASDMASLELPDPAIDPRDDRSDKVDRDGDDKDHVHFTSGPGRPESQDPSSVSLRHVSAPSHSDTKPTTPKTPESSAKRKSQLLKRVFPHQDVDSPTEKQGQLEAPPSSEVDRRQDEFFAFLDDELEKIESFYHMKEEEASHRLQMLRRQLHIMRDQRIQEVLGAQKKSGKRKKGKKDGPNPKALTGLNGNLVKDVLTGRNRFGKNTEALVQMATTTPRTLQAQDRESITRRRDFSRRPEEEELDEAEEEDDEDSPNVDVPYRSAKRKLKHALQEFYRGLELLKGYAYLNRTAFRKINKKYDKTVQARPTLRYMSEKVNKAWFVQSEVTENLMVATEDLYARYFERGNRKLAVSKLRRIDKKSGDYSSNTFRSGLLLMAGILFGIQSLVYVGQHMSSKDPTLHVHTSYLLQQIYGGYFLVVFHFLLFALVCMVWTKAKINHVFIFEFDTRHALEWRQLLEIPCFFLFLLGLFMWLNFLTVNAMYIYWPVVLVGLTLIILFLPFRVLYHRSRQWWAYSNWRLALAGLYPVEFRDFFLGDMYCSQTYAMGNIELFFCLYARHWSDPPQCNSSHSRLLGFFQCLPAVWRAFQCLRRYADTRNMFPHMMNFGKYIFSVLYYATLSMYRIQRIQRFEATFITFALLNAVYTSVWDLAMDWSLGNPYAKHPLLREVLAFRQVWVYYVAMVLDVIIRFNWIFYAIFAHDLQHSAVLSFVISFSEVCRRGVWTIFRVENEHCTNVLLFRASRDTPLPYDLPNPPEEPDHHRPEDVQLQEQPPSTGATIQPSPNPEDLEQGPVPPTPAGASMRTLRGSRAAAGLSRVGSIVAAAHAQDFERRKRPDQMHPASVSQGNAQSPEDSSEEEEDDLGDAEAHANRYAGDNLEDEMPFGRTRTHRTHEDDDE
ncbi:hypothetical protein SI65_03889 [Aspergillus cristatus]|uniref:Signal transduction protein Syg1 n=1 Tax=Aspergillus cristatus TaxID=573508 RepID=A0A1E3BKF6_ASPCR|nr:hypothetical protein SI65_03889 [Aspergillus cristatus]